MLFRWLWSLLQVLVFIGRKTVSEAPFPTPEEGCGQVPLIANGLITLANQTDSTYGSVASVTCNTGYKSNTWVISCTENGTWEMPDCREIDCGEYNLVFGRYTYMLYFFGTTYGSVVFVDCANGYELNGGDFAVCDADGVWSNNITCELTVSQDELNATLFEDCSQVPLIENGSITLTNQTDSTHGEMASVTCNTDYNSNTSMISCMENGICEMPVCREIDCGEYNLVFGKWLYKLYFFGTTYGSEVFVGCADGYELNGGDFAVCEADGVWSNYTTCQLIGYNTTTPLINCTADGTWQIPSCKIKDCGNFPVIDNGRITQQNTHDTTYGAMANVSCNTGYNTTTPLINCTADGTWQIPSCKIIDCGSVPAVDFGTIILDTTANKTFGVSASVACSDGFEANTSTIYCQESGVWDSAACFAKDCGTLQAIDFGTLTLDDLANSTYGATATVSCIDGFETNNSTIFCLESGVWDNATCFAKDCGNLSTFDYGTLTLDDPANSTYGASAYVGCIDGFETNTSTIFCLASGVWDNAACFEKDCGPVLVIDFGTITLDDLPNSTYGASASVSCIDGFETNTSIIFCLASGVWDNATCFAKDCGNVPSIDNGRITPQNTQNTGYGAKATVSCNTGYNTTTTIINCTANGTWETPSCKIIDCSNLTKAPENGSLVPLKSTTYKTVATYTCKTGYQIVGSATRQCLANATWSSVIPTCKIRDCGSVSGPQNGRIVNTTVVTTYGAKLLFACNVGYVIVGESSIICLSTGKWSGATPSCYQQKPKTCTNNIDSRGTVWPETPVSTTVRKPCQEGFEGNVTRYCNADGIWQLPQYKCVRTAVEVINEKVNTLTENATADEVNYALKEITKVAAESTAMTNTSERLTDGELTALATSLEKVAVVISRTEVVNDDITDSFMESASNLIDTSNQDSWKSLSATNDSGAGKVLTAVESIGTAFARSLNDSTTPKKPVVKRNLALEVERVSGNGNKSISFPSPESVNASTNDTMWIAQSQSKITLQLAALKDKNTVHFIIAVMYRDMSEILPSTITNNSSGDSVDETVINGPVLSLSIIPAVNTTLDPPIIITFEHDFLNFTAPQCAYWNPPSNSWFTDGCILSESNDSFTTCKCNHLTNFAVLMSPFQQADALSKALRIISIVGIGISILCLVITLLVHFILWKYLRNDRTTVMMNLCIALLLGYILFLGGVDRTENRVACVVIAAMLHYIFLVVFSVMLVEGILIAITVLYVFNTKSRIKVLLTLAWVVPAVIVGISLGTTKTSGYGNKDFCWLSSENGVKWAFVGPALLIILINIICLLLVIRALFGTKAMETKKFAEKVKTSLRSLGVLVPLMGVSWIVGIFYVNESFSFVQYIFAALNSLQGFFIFVFHCLLNKQVKRSIGLKIRRKSSAAWLKSSARSTSRDYKSAKDLRETGKSYIDDFSRSQDWRDKRSTSRDYKSAIDLREADKSYVDNYSRSQDWRDKVLENTITSSRVELHFTSPMKGHEPRRLAVAFGPAVRDSLSGTLSREDTSNSRSDLRVADERRRIKSSNYSHGYSVGHLSSRRIEDFNLSSRL